MGLLPGTVSAAGPEASGLWLENSAATNAVNGIVEQNRGTPYIRSEQYVPQWQKLETQSRGRNGGSTDVGAVVRYPGTLAVSQIDLNSIWHFPVDGPVKITSPFGPRRNPVYGGYEFHDGIDLDGYTGDLILAARGGTVTKVAYSWSAGYYIRIDHGDGFETVYYHLSRQLVVEGQQVCGGEAVGKMGSTGMSTGSHLHFGVSLNGEWVDPAEYILFE